VGKLKDYWNSGEKKEEAASASSGGQAARTGTQGVSSAKPGIKEYYSGYSAKPAGTQPAASGSAGGVSYTPPERDRKQLTASLTEQVAGYMRNPSYGESYASARRAQETRERNAAARAAAAASETQAAGRSAAEITADISAGRTAKNETGKAYADLLAREETLKKSLSAAEETRNASYERFLRELDAYPDLSETERQELISGWHDDQYDEALRNYNEQHGALAESLESAKRADEDAASALEDYWSELYENAYGAPDFAERSKYRSTANGRENYLDPLGEYYSLGYDSEEYERVNRNRDVIDILEAYEASSGLRRAGLDEGQIAEMNDDEIAMYNYLYSAVSPETASEYLRNITSDLNYRERMRTETEARKRADENPGQAQAEIILRNLAKRDEYLYQWLDKLDDGMLDQNAAYNKQSFISNAMTDETSRNIRESAGRNVLEYNLRENREAYAAAVEGYKKLLDSGAITRAEYNELITRAEQDFLSDEAISELYGEAAKRGEASGNTLSFLYQTGMSTANFLANLAASGGNEWVSLLSMGAGAGADALIDAKDRGLSDNRALALGAIAGFAEIITEKVSIEALFDTDLTGFRYLIKNIVSEGSEEVGSDIINFIADNAISGSEAEFRKSMREYLEENPGASEQDALKAAMLDTLGDWGLDALGGALSGGFMAIPGTISNSNTSNRGSGTNAQNVRQAAPQQAMPGDISGLVAESVAAQQENAQTQNTEAVLDETGAMPGDVSGNVAQYVAANAEEAAAPATASIEQTNGQKNTASEGEAENNTDDYLLADGEFGIDAKKTTSGAIGYDSEGRPIYQNNFPEGTSYTQKKNFLFNLVRKVWSKKPITLTIIEDGRPKRITAQFSDSAAPYSDAEHIAKGSRYSSRSGNKVKDSIANDLYSLTETAKYDYSKEESGKDYHPGVTVWHYFVNEFSYKGVPYSIVIDVKETNSGNYVYNYTVKKIGMQNESAPHGGAGVLPTPLSPNTTIPQSGEGVNSNSTTAEAQNTANAAAPNTAGDSAGLSDSRTIAPDESVGAAPAGFGESPWSAFVYDAEDLFETGENPDRNISLPTENPRGQALTKAAQTIMESANTPDERVAQIQNAILNSDSFTRRVTNDAEIANRYIEQAANDFGGMLREWERAVDRGIISNDVIIQGAVILDIVGNNQGVSGEDYQRIAQEYCDLCSEAGRALQATRVFKTLTPMGQTMAIEKVISDMNNRFKKANIEVPQELYDTYLAAETEEQRSDAYNAIIKEIARQKPSTLVDMWTALRYTNMLGNFRTQARNIIGNTAQWGVYTLKNNVALAMEQIASEIDPEFERSKSLRVGKDWMAAAKELYLTMADTVAGESRYQEGTRGRILSDIRDEARVFKVNGENTGWRKAANAALMPMEAYRKFTNWMMTEGDNIFIGHHFARALAGYLKANGVTVEQFREGKVDTGLYERAVDYATQQAREATYHDNNVFSNWVSKMGRRSDTPAAARVAAEGVLPFRKTPANVAARGEEFSAFGIINTTVDAIKAAKGEAQVNKAIDDAAKVLTGTGLLALGYVLAKKGWLRGVGDPDDDKVDALMNRQDYSIVIPGKGSYTLSWIGTVALPLLMGANIAELADESEIPFVDALTRITDPMIETSMLSGLSDTLDTIRYSQTGLLTLAVDAVVGYLTQGITSTLVGQLERIGEENRMTSYTTTQSWLGKYFQRQLGKASQKIPGWDYNQSEYLNEFGDTESNGNIVTRVIENLISPGYWTETHEGEAVYDLIQQVQDETGNAKFPAEYPDSSYTSTSGGRRALTQEEKERQQKTEGSTYVDGVEILLDQINPEKADMDVVADIMADIEERATKNANKELRAGWGEDYMDSNTKWDRALTAWTEYDIPLMDYYVYEDGVDGIVRKWDGKINDDEGKKQQKRQEVTAYIGSLGLSVEQRLILWERAGYAESTFPW